MRTKRIQRVFTKFGDNDCYDSFHDELMSRLCKDPDVLKKYPEIVSFRDLSSIIDQLEKIINSMEDKVDSIRRDFDLSTRDLSSSNQKLWEVQSLIDVMLSSVEEGYFIFNKDGICLDFSSKRCLDLLGVIPNGKPLKKVLKISPQSEEHFDRWIKALCFGPLDFDEVTPLAPDFNCINNRHIDVKYLPMKKADELIGVVVVVKDLTQQKISEEKERLMNEKSQLLLNFHKSRSWYISFFEFIKKGISSYLKKSNIDEGAINPFKRYIHSVKGGAYSLKLEQLGDFIHQVEDEIQEMIDSQIVENIPKIAKRINKKITLILEEHEEIFNFEGEKRVEVRLKELITMGKNLYKIDPEIGIDFSRRFLMIDLIAYFDEMKLHVQNICKKNQKIIKIVLNGKNKVFLFPKKYERFLFEMNNVFVNAITHGIEKEAERISQNKDPVGVISVNVSMDESNTVILEISDDGAGIDKHKIAKKMNIDEKDVSDEVIEKVIFSDGFSVKDKAGKLAGRGVGLGSVKESLDDMNGSVKIKTEKNKGTSFIFSIPVKKFSDELNEYENKTLCGG